MAGQHYVVECFRLTMHELHYRLTIAAMNAMDTAVQAHTALELIEDPLNVLATATGNRAPLGTILQLYKTVILAETKKGDRRIVQHLIGRSRPDRGPHGYQVLMNKAATVAALMQHLAQRLGLYRRIINQPRRFTVKAHQIGQHFPVARAQQVTLLRKQTT